MKMNAVSEDSETESVNQFFHILGMVQNPRGGCVLSDGNYEITFWKNWRERVMHHEENK